MNINERTLSKSSQSVLATHKVLRNTYLLLGMTLLFSAAMAALAVVTNAPPMNILFMIVGMYGLMFLTHRLQNSPWGIASIFAFTGFLGYTLGPVLNIYLHRFTNGSELMMTALGGTGLIFFALSAYVLTTRKDFSFLSSFLFVGFVVALLAMIGGIFFQIPALQLTVSAIFMLLSSGFILFHTSAIIHGGEKNYIVATIGIFVALYNIFLSLLQILGVFGGRE